MNNPIDLFDTTPILKRSSSWVAFEGTDGVGKSAVGHQIYEWLLKQKLSVHFMNEFSNTPLGKMIRDIIDQKTFFMMGIDNRHIPIAETLVLAADLVMQRELNSTQTNDRKLLLLSDRGLPSFYVYQGMRLRSHYGEIQDWDKWIDGIFNPIIGQPDLTLCFISPMDQIERRLRERGDKVTNDSLDFIERAQEDFLRFGLKHPNTFVVLNNEDGHFDDTVDQAKKIITDLIIPLL